MQKAAIARLVFVCLALIDIAFEAFLWSPGIWVVKPMLMPALIVYLLLATQRATGATRWLLAVSLVFSLAGDVLLMAPISKFVPGLVAFLIAHLLYIAAFTRGAPMRSGPGMATTGKVVAAAPFPAFGIAVFLYAKDDLGPMLIPVTVYTATILTMGLAALSRYGKVSTKSFALVMIGAVLFIVSDSTIAVNKFIAPVPGHRLLIMTTYLSAQFLIVHGIVLQLRDSVSGAAGAD